MKNNVPVLLALVFAMLALGFGLIGLGLAEPEMMTAPYLVVICYGMSWFCMWHSGVQWQRAYENVPE
jgi:high-affinity Fe2+/Pb2+ permease